MNGHPKKYEILFDNFSFWKQFRGQVGSLGLTSQKGEAFLVLEVSNLFFEPSNLCTQTMLTCGKYQSTEEHSINALLPHS